MRKYTIRFFFILLTVSFIMILDRQSAFAKQKQTEEQEVLFLSSYSYDWPAVQLQIQGLKESLSEFVLVQYEFMNTKRLPYEEAAAITYRTLSEEKERGLMYDAVIVGDDAALQFVLDYQNEFFAKIPIVFEGINDLDRAISAGENEYITGVVEKASYGDNIDIALKLYPDATRLVAIVDNTITGIGEQKQFLSYKEKYEGLSFSILNTSYYTQEQLANEVKRLLDEKTIAFYLNANEDSKQSIHSIPDGMNTILENSPIPVFRMVQVGIGEGFLGGIAVSHKELGSIAANMINEIFSGTDVKNIPVNMESPSYPYFDYEVMEKYGISTKDLPKNSIIINQPQNFWSDNKNVILPFSFVLCVLIVFMIILSYDNYRKRCLTRLLLETQGQLNHLMDDIPGGIAIFNKEREIQVIYFNDGLSEMYQYSREEMEEEFQQNHLFLTHPDDWNVIQPVLKECNQIGKVVNLIFRRKRKNGEYRWTNMKAKLINQDSRLLYYCVFVDVNSSKENELAARIEHEKFEIALNNMRVNIWEYDIQKQQRIQSSRNLVFPYPKVMDHFPQCMINSTLVHKDSIDTYKRLHDQVREGAKTAIGEVQFQNMNGKYTWHRIKYTTIFDDYNQPIKAVGISEDISLQERYKEELKKIQEICNFTVENEYQDVFTIDVDAEIVRMFFAAGKNVGKLDEKPYQEVYEDQLHRVVKEDQEIYKRYMNMSKMIEYLEKSAGTVVFTIRYYQNDKIGWAECKYTYFGNDTSTVLVLISDISEALLAEKKSKEELAEALEQAKAAAKSKEDFLSYMSHEMRTPLNGISGMLDLLIQKEEWRGEEYLKNAIISAKHLSGLINDVLDMSRIESGKFILHDTYASKKDITEYINAVIQPMAEEKRLHFQINWAASDYKRICIDKGRLQQILINLLSNAVKYTNPGGDISLTVTEEEVEKDKIFVTFIVQDNGIGMTEEFLKIAFEPFEREHTLERNGTGLGLAITKLLTKVMGGSIHIESEVGKGTQVYVSLTAEASTEEVSEHEVFLSDSQINQNSHSFQNIHALLVEDNEINQEIARVQLESMGLSVSVVENGMQAVERFMKSENQTYQIIFMDIMMPVMDGLTAAKEIRKLDRSDAKSVPIVAMTANAFAEDVHRSLESGMQYHLSKPFEKEQMEEILLKEFGHNEM